MLFPQGAWRHIRPISTANNSLKIITCELHHENHFIKQLSDNIFSYLKGSTFAYVIAAFVYILVSGYRLLPLLVMRTTLTASQRSPDFSQKFWSLAMLSGGFFLTTLCEVIDIWLFYTLASVTPSTNYEMFRIKDYHSKYQKIKLWNYVETL